MKHQNTLMCLVNFGGVDLELFNSPTLAANFQVTTPPADREEKCFVSSVSVLPEHTAWVASENQSAPAH